MKLSFSQRYFCDYANAHLETQKTLSFAWPRRHGCTTATMIFALNYAQTHPGSRIVIVVNFDFTYSWHVERCLKIAQEMKVSVQPHPFHNRLTLTNRSTIFWRTSCEEKDIDLILCDYYKIPTFDGRAQEIPTIVHIPVSQMRSYPGKIDVVLSRDYQIQTRLYALIRKRLDSDLSRYLFETVLGYTSQGGQV